MNITINETNEAPDQNPIKVLTPFNQSRKLLGQTHFHSTKMEIIEPEPFHSKEIDLTFKTKSASFIIVMEASDGLESFSLDKNEDVPGEIVVDNRTGHKSGVSWIRYWHCKPWAAYTITLIKKEGVKQSVNHEQEMTN